MHAQRCTEAGWGHCKLGECRSPWVIPFGEGSRARLQACKGKLVGPAAEGSDHLALVSAFDAWQALPPGRQHGFTVAHCLSQPTMVMLSRMRQQIVGELVACGLLQSRSTLHAMSCNASSCAILRCVLVRAHLHVLSA
jgi:hypothetical protein